MTSVPIFLQDSHDPPLVVNPEPAPYFVVAGHGAGTDLASDKKGGRIRDPGAAIDDIERPQARSQAIGGQGKLKTGPGLAFVGVFMDAARVDEP